MATRSRLRGRPNNRSTRIRRGGRGTRKKAGRTRVVASGGWTPWIDLKSSNLAAARYNAFGSRLEIRFREGSEYLYLNVPSYVFGDLLDAISPGRFFKLGIQNSYNSVKK